MTVDSNITNVATTSGPEPFNLSAPPLVSQESLLSRLQKQELLLQARTIADLDIITLVLIYNLINSDNVQVKELFEDTEQHNKAIFLVRDQIFRQFYENQDRDILEVLKTLTLPNCTILLEQIDKIIGNDRFLKTIKRTNNAACSFFQSLSFEPAKKEIEESPTRPMRILHATVEYKGKAHAGGVGTVVDQMSRGQSNMSETQGAVITGFYSFLKSDFLKTAKFKGCVEFPFKNEIVKCSIYRVSNPDGVEHFLIEPDPKHAELFELNKGQGVYSWHQHSPTLDRLGYTSGAIAAFTSRYQGNDGRAGFDIVQSHNPVLGGLTANLMHYYNHSLLESDHKEVAPIILGHGAAPGDEIPVDPQYLEDLAIEVPSYIFEVPLLGLAYAWSWQSVWVSNTRKQEALRSDSVLGLHKIASHLNKNGSFHAVTNGCEPDAFSILSNKAYGDDALAIENKDYISAKKKMKKRLHDEGLIASPDKDLFLWVGRLDPHIKGIDILLSMVDEIRERGAQCVVMGFPLDPDHCTKEVQALKDYAERYPETLKVYDKKPDQLDTFADSSYNKGRALRYAADVMLLPSRSEGAPMVVQELFSVGAVLCSSNAGGIPDYSRDYDEHPKEFNAFTFDCNLSSSRKMAKNARQAVARTFDKYLSLSEEERNKRMHEWITSVDNRWRWDGKNGPLKEYQNIYTKATEVAKTRLKDKTKENPLIKNNKHVFTKSIRYSGKNILAIIKYVFRRIVVRIRTMFKRIRKAKKGSTNTTTQLHVDKSTPESAVS